MAQEDIRAWYGIRIKTIHEKVSMHDLLRKVGVTLSHRGDREEQFSCPIHGKDENPSARVYPANARRPSHAWCFVCREPWDVISFWKRYYHGDAKRSFHRTLSEIEREFGLPTPEIPKGLFDGQSPASEQSKGNEVSRADFDRMYETCELRLRGAREDYVRLGAMRAYLMAGSVLDRIYYQVGEGLVSYAEGLNVLNSLLKRIGDRVRGVTTDQASDP